MEKVMDPAPALPKKGKQVARKIDQRSYGKKEQC